MKFNDLIWDDIHLVLRSHTNEWEVSRSSLVSWEDEFGERNSLMIPVGATTDFASVPRLLRWLISKVGNHARAAIIHDVLHREPGCRPAGMDRTAADELMRVVAVLDKTRRWKARCIYWGVRIGGKKAWIKEQAK